MSWTDIARAQHKPDTGRKRTMDLREVMNAIVYIASTGCPWRMLPKDFPPMTTVQGYFYSWRDMGLLELINDLLVRAAREIEGRSASPSAGIIDSQSVKTTESRVFVATMLVRKSKGANATY